MLTELNTENFETEIWKGLKLVEFYTTWCGYCKKQKPELEKLEKIWIGLVDADESPAIAAKYDVSGFPTFIIFKDGKALDRFSGLRSKEFIMDKIMDYLDV